MDKAKITHVWSTWWCGWGPLYGIQAWRILIPLAGKDDGLSFGDMGGHVGAARRAPCPDSNTVLHLGEPPVTFSGL